MSAPTRTRSTRPRSALAPGSRVTSLMNHSTQGRTRPYADDPQPKGRRLKASTPVGRRSKSFVTLLALVMVLNFVGLTMILSASSVLSNEDTGSPWTMFFKQLLWFVLGFAAMVVTMRHDYRTYRRRAGYGVVGVLILLVLVIFVGVRVNGAKRWLGFGQFTIQPSEIAKLALIVFWADLLSRRAKWINDARLTFLPVVLTCVITAGLIMGQPNLGTSVIVFFIMLSMLFVAGSPLRWIFAVVSSGALATAGFLILSPWRAARLEAFRNPWTDTQGAGFQILNAQAAVANGGPTGTSLGQSRAKWGFLPEANTDFIFAILAEETGLIGALLTIALFIAIGVTGIRVAMSAPDRFGMLLATGITTWFLVQAFLNIGQSIGALPVMGVPLPFISAGGSSLVVGMVAVGILLNIARQTRV